MEPPGTDYNTNKVLRTLQPQAGVIMTIEEAVTIANAMTPEQWADSAVNADTRKLIAKCGNLPALQDALTLEQAKKNPRMSLVKWVQFRITVLEALQDAPEPDKAQGDQESTSEVIEPSQAPQSLAEGLRDLRAELDAPVAPPALALVPEPAPEPDPVAVIEEVQAEAPPELEPTETENCALVFLRACRDGNAVMAQEMIRQIRLDDGGDQETAKALIWAWSQVAAKNASKGSKNKKGTGNKGPRHNQAGQDALAALIGSVEKNEDGTINLSQEQLRAAGLPGAWVQHRWHWKMSGAGLAAGNLGFTAVLGFSDKVGTLTLTPVATP